MDQKNRAPKLKMFWTLGNFPKKMIFSKIWQNIPLGNVHHVLLWTVIPIFWNVMKHFLF